ncbi:MAG: hypothetical protein ACO1SV_15260 [Fimbriimonas sp.]
MSTPDATTHLEILGATERNGKTFWTRIGTAFPTKDGQGYRLKLDFMPMDAETGLLLLPPRAAQEATEAA